MQPKNDKRRTPVTTNLTELMINRAKWQSLVALLLVLVLVHPEMSIAGSITRPTSAEFVLGVTTKEYCLDRFGDTSARDIIYLDGGTQDAGDVTSLAYFGRWRLFANSVRSGVTTRRYLGLQFNNGLLLKYRFLSTYKEDSTDFDETKAEKIEKGKTTLGEVLELLGEPSGMAAYPSAKHKGDTRLLYEYGEHDTDARTMLKKELQIDLDANDVVRDFNVLVEKSTNVSDGGNSTQFLLVPIYRKR